MSKSSKLLHWLSMLFGLVVIFGGAYIVWLIVSKLLTFTTTIPEFKKWLKEGDTKKPFADWKKSISGKTTNKNSRED